MKGGWVENGKSFNLSPPRGPPSGPGPEGAHGALGPPMGSIGSHRALWGPKGAQGGPISGQDRPTWTKIGDEMAEDTKADLQDGS